jgi:hypothetical protein
MTEAEARRCEKVVCDVIALAREFLPNHEGRSHEQLRQYYEWFIRRALLFPVYQRQVLAAFAAVRPMRQIDGASVFSPGGAILHIDQIVSRNRTAFGILYDYVGRFFPSVRECLGYCPRIGRERRIPLRRCSFLFMNRNSTTKQRREFT